MEQQSNEPTFDFTCYGGYDKDSTWYRATIAFMGEVVWQGEEEYALEENASDDADKHLVNSLTKMFKDVFNS